MTNAEATPERRRELRAEISLDVHVSGTDSQGQPFEQPAIATDISMSGALLVFPHRIGDCTIISVSYHAKAARFRIVWRTDLGSQICKIAAYKVESDSCPWTEL